MPTLAPCPSCSVTLKLPARASGVVTCRQCGTRVAVTAPGGPTRRPGRRRRSDAGPLADVPDLPAWALPASGLIAVFVFISAGLAWRFPPSFRSAEPVAVVPPFGAAAPAPEFVAAQPAPRAFEFTPAPRVPEAPPAPPAADPPAPPGFTLSKRSHDGYRVLLPIPTGLGGTRGLVHSHRAVPGPAGDPDPLRAGLRLHGRHTAPWDVWHEPRPVTVGGQPGLEARVGHKPDWNDGPPVQPRPPTGNPVIDQRAREHAEAAERARQERVAQRLKDAYHTVLVYTIRRGRGYLIELKRQGDFPDDATVRTVVESFTFLD